MSSFVHEKRNVALLVFSQMLFMIASITVMTLSGVVGAQLSPDPALATLPIALMMLGTVVSTLPASLFMKKVGRRLGFLVGAAVGVVVWAAAWLVLSALLWTPSGCLPWVI